MFDTASIHVKSTWFPDSGITYRVTLELPHGPLARYVKLWVTQAPGMQGIFSTPPQVSDPNMHHRVTHVPCCMPGSITSGFLGSKWRGKLSRHSRHMCNPYYYVSGRRPMVKSMPKVQNWLVSCYHVIPRIINWPIKLFIGFTMVFWRTIPTWLMKYLQWFDYIFMLLSDGLDSGKHFHPDFRF